MNPERQDRPVRAILYAGECLLREGLRRVLEARGVVVAVQCATAEELARRAGAHPHDLVIVVEGSRRSGDALTAAVDLRRRLPASALLVVASGVRRAVARELLADGAAGIGYVLDARIEDVERFLETVRRVAGGGTVLDPEVVGCLLAGEDALDMLTTREREVAALIADGRSNRGIAQRLVVTEDAVEKHVGSILAKFDIPPGVAAHRRVLAVLTYLRRAEIDSAERVRDGVLEAHRFAA